MVLRVPQLKQAILRHLPIAARTGGINSHLLRLQLIDPEAALVQDRLKTLPLFIVAQQLQPARQPVVAEIQSPYFRPQAALQRSQPSLGPSFDLVQPVVRLRQDMAQPARQHFSQAQSLPFAVHYKILVQQFSYSHALRRCHQDRDVIHHFRRYRKLFGHPQSLPQFLNQVKT